METNPSPRDFRLYLQQELMRRCRQNEKYSLRSFAKSLRISSSALSAILNGKRPLTRKSALRLAASLGLSAAKIQEINLPRGRGARAPETQQLALDTFACIADWYHFPILELIRVRGFRPDRAWVARKLGLTRSEVNAAVERLERVGLLRITEKGDWVDNSANGNLTTIHGNLTSDAAIMLQNQILDLSRRALQEVSPEARNHTALSVAIHPEDLPKAKERIRKFGRELAEFFERNGRPEQVYQISCALFPLTKLDT